MLDQDQIGFVKEAFKTYLRLYRENKAGEGRFCDTPTLADIDHSALLHRLLSGKEPLPKPPPLTFSYPNYKLGEGEAYEVFEIYDWHNNTVIIDQSTQWTYERKPEIINALRRLNISLAPDATVLKHDNGDYYHLYIEHDKKFLRKLI